MNNNQESDNNSLEGSDSDWNPELDEDEDSLSDSSLIEDLCKSVAVVPNRRNARHVKLLKSSVDALKQKDGSLPISNLSPAKYYSPEDIMGMEIVIVTTPRKEEQLQLHYNLPQAADTRDEQPMATNKPLKRKAQASGNAPVQNKQSKNKEGQNDVEDHSRSEAEDDPMTPDNDPMIPEHDPMPQDHSQSEAEDDPMTPDDDPIIPVYDPMIPEHDPMPQDHSQSEAEDDPMTPDGDPMIPEHAPMPQLDDPITTQEDPVPPEATNNEPDTATKQKRPTDSAQKNQRAKQKHPLLPPCKDTCRRSCIKNIHQDRRIELHKQFWEMNYNARRQWVCYKIKNKAPKQRTADPLPSGDRKRNVSRFYYLPIDNNFTDDSDDEYEKSGTAQVCQHFFLSTLGYTSNRFLVELFESRTDKIAPQKDQRGNHPPQNKICRDLIKEHINSYHPQVSHYNREHAPNRRYLSPDISKDAMFTDFKQKYPMMKCGREVYRKTVSDMNIGFYESNPEKCSECLTYELATGEENEILKRDHLIKVQAARQEYRKDETLNDETPNMSVYATDLQKVVLLPRFPDVKASFFCPRLVTFNETFASMAKSTNKTKRHIYVVWHEGVAGRSAEEVANTYLKVIQEERDATKVIFWLDNCSGQNKNWFLFSALLCCVNSSIESNIECIELKYLVTGHTFMAADGLHGKIEQGMRKKKNILDLSDFVDVLKNSSKRADVVLMKPTDFRLLDNKFRVRRSLNNETMPLLRNICAVKFTKGEKVFSYKTKFANDYTPLVADAVKKRANLSLTCATQTVPRGINTAKKEKIMKELVSKMPLNRRVFWNELSVNDASVDLLGERCAE